MLRKHDSLSPFRETSVNSATREGQTFFPVDPGKMNPGETPILKPEQYIVNSHRAGDGFQLHSEKRMTVGEFQSQLSRQLRCIRFANCLPWQ